jgi:tetratricopeptide (TPR) repeat protein
MARHRFALVFLAVLSLSTAMVTAAEPYLQFVEKLRQRQYFDIALDYLERAESRPDLPADVKAVLPFEKATTLIALSKEQKNSDVALATLNKAQLFLEQFLKTSPDHPKAAKASSDVAEVLKTRGIVAMRQSRSPSNAAKKQDSIRLAKESFAQAKVMFNAASEKYTKEYKAFGPHVDKAKDPEKYEQWTEVEKLAYDAQLDAVIIEYEEAQTFEKDDPKYKAALKAVGLKFEDLHARYRLQKIGVIARVYQGKCFEEQGELQKALGIYSDVLTNKGDTPSMRNLMAQTMHFKLICLNSAANADSVVVDKLATEWLKENASLARTTHGIGIRYEQARALEAMSKDKTIDLPDDRKKQVLNEAHTIARAIASQPGEYRDRAQSMGTRLLAALNRDGKEPKDFDTAYSMARELVNKLKEMGDGVKAAKSAKDQDPEEIKKLEREYGLHINETVRLLKLTLSLRNSNSKLAEVNSARFHLCYVYYLQDKVYDSAVLGEWLATHYAGDEENDVTASDAAYVAMGAYSKAVFNTKGSSDKRADIQKMIAICDFIVKKWPKTTKEIDAWWLLGSTYLQTKEYEKAAEAFQKIPPDAAKYLDAQLKLGQTLSDAAIESMNKSADERPSQEKIEGLQKQAQDVLKKAISILEPKLAEGEQLPDGLAVAKLTLAQIANQTNQFADAIKFLEKDTRSVVSAMALPEGETRPLTGIHSEKFANEAYKQIIRAHIGLQDLDSARKAMAQMEKLASGQGRDILPIYVNLGRQFKEELDRLAKADEKEYQATLKSFESFLDNMLARKEGQTYNSLVWIGTMYISLGEGMEDKAISARFFAQGSQAFHEVISKQAEDAKFCTPEQLLSAKAQLVVCKRKAGEFVLALELIQDLLKQRPNAIDTQSEAARIYQDWAAAGKADSGKKWNMAMLGDDARAQGDPKIGMWGWAGLYKKMATSRESAKFKEQLLDARYNIAFCLLHRGLAEEGEKRTKSLNMSHADISRTALQNIFTEEQYTRFNSLYREVAKSLGQRPSDLPLDKTSLAAQADKNKPDANRKAKAASNDVAGSAKDKVKDDKKGAAGAAKSESFALMMMGGVVAIAVLGGVAWIFLSTGKKKKRNAVAREIEEDVGFGTPTEDTLQIPDEIPLLKRKPAPSAGQSAGAATSPRNQTGASAARPKTSRPKPE